MTKLTIVFSLLSLLTIIACTTAPINRRKVVERHQVIINEADSLSPLTVGNGNFAFTVDITGLQSFPEFYNRGIVLGTQSNWGWHSFPNTENFTLSQTYKTFNVNNREVKYVHDYRNEGTSIRAKASEYLRANPHRMNLGTLGFEFTNNDGKKIEINDLESVSQTLNPYNGCIKSIFKVHGTEVKVETVCHASKDAIGVKIQSPLLKSGRLKIKFCFSKPDDNWKNQITPVGASENIGKPVVIKNGSTIYSRTLDDFIQTIQFKAVDCKVEMNDSCYYIIPPPKSDYELVAIFDNLERNTNLSFPEVKTSSENSWSQFWESGAAIDFGQCKDKRAFELERRVILSQYLTRAQCAGNLPPQETGLTMNSWHGKFHMEMIWWHGAHFSLWNRSSILEKQLNYYHLIIENAKQTAQNQGYLGARWPKMTDEGGNESPSTVGTYLIWQQPHVIFLLDLITKNKSEDSILFTDAIPLIWETAQFMADFPLKNSETGYYDLSSPLIPAQERFAAENTINPAFELVYWRYTLNQAIEYYKKQNGSVPEKWINVRDSLAPLTIQNEKYLFTENATDSYSNQRYLTDHPMVLGIWGMLPKTDFVDSVTFENTYQSLKTSWNWNETWGWDFPMAAMAAAELGHYNDAIDFLLKDETTNTYLPNGHNYQDERLPFYLPGNGALLTAVAQMARKNQFPKDGKWKVIWED